MERTIARMGAAGAAALVGSALLGGCQCCPPVGECSVNRTEVEISKTNCCPTKSNTLVTVIHRTGEACATLPPVGEITVVRNSCARTKMVFVNVRPTDDRYYNVENRSFERPWPWGPYGTGEWRDY